MLRPGGKAAAQFVGRDEADVVFDEIQARFQIGQQIEQIAAHLLERPRQSAGQLPQRDLQLVAIGGIDHPQHGFGLGQINPAGEKRSQREFTRLRETCSAATNRLQDRGQQRRRTEACEFRPAVGACNFVRPAKETNLQE